MRIDIKLFPNRRLYGTLTLWGDNPTVPLFQCPCMGRADAMLAVRAGNPTRDPLKHSGDTPTGGYSGLVSAPITRDPRGFGPDPVIRLTATGGEALKAANEGLPGDSTDGHRSGILIHGGDLGPTGALRPTAGCVRVGPGDMAKLMKMLKLGQAVSVLINQHEENFVK